MPTKFFLRCRLIAIASWLLLFGGVSEADTIYSTLGPQPFGSNDLVYDVGWLYSASSAVGGGIGIAAPFFLSTSTYQLNSVTLDIGLTLTERSPNLQIAIYADDGGHPSLIPITTLEPNPSLVMTLVDRRLTTYLWVGQTILSPSTLYWLAMQPHTVGVTTEDYNGRYVLSSSVLPPTMPVTRREYFGGTWHDWTVYPNQLQPVFQLDGTAVPEPSTWALLALGTAAFCCATRRRRK